MKKIILFLLLFTSLYSDSKVYIGSSYGYCDEEFNGNADAQSSTDMAKIKVGYGDRESYAIEFSLDYINNQSKIFSDNDSEKYGINVEFVKAFDLDIYVNPFFKAGFGAGFVDIQRELQQKLNYSSFNLGLGMFIPINEHFDLELGYDYKSTSYEAIDTIVDQVRFSSKTNTIYFGFNVRF